MEIDDEGSFFGAIDIDFSTLGGLPDGETGLVLVDHQGKVIDAIGYGVSAGSFVALDGPAAGLSIGDIGVSESGATPVGDSLYLTGGPGTVSQDFSWTGPLAATRGDVNTGQTFP